jgi:lysozyme
MLRRATRSATVLITALLALTMFAPAGPAQATVTPGGGAAILEADCPRGTGPSPSIREVQCLLNRALVIGLTDPLPLDGDNGSITQVRIRQLQSCAGIGANGTVGPGTLAQLRRWAQISYDTGQRIC